MKTVRIQDSLYYGKPLFGDFPFVSERPGDVDCQREMYVRIVRNGKEINVHANRDDWQIVGDTESGSSSLVPMGETEEEMKKRIARNFAVMAKITEMIVKCKVRSTIISGAAGIGKSHNLEERLNSAVDNGEINMFTILKGKISAIALFAQLFEHRNKGDVLVLDDIDVIFQDETSLNLLKAALDTGDRRHLVWLTASSWLEENGIDQEFDFEGACVFITNMDFDRMIDRGSNLAPHFKALVNRSNYLNLGIHTNQEILIHIKSTIENTTMLEKHDIDDDQKEMMIDWMDENFENIRELSLRTVLKLASYMNADPVDWRDTADVIMIKKSNRF